MRINNHDFCFAYTVRSMIGIGELNLKGRMTRAEDAKSSAQIAVLMSEAYEKRQKMLEPSYEPRILTIDEVYNLSPDGLERLKQEINMTIQSDSKITVNVDSKKKETAEQ